MSDPGSKAVRRTVAGVFALTAVLAAIPPAMAETSGKLLEEGRQLMATGDVKSAQIHFKKAVKESPKDPVARFELGTAEFHLSDYAAAERDFILAGEYGFPAERTLPMTAMSMLLQGKYDKVLTALAPCPQDTRCKTEILAARARAELGLKNTAAADASSRQAIELDPNNLRAAQARAIVLLAQGDTAQAEKLADKILAADPNQPEALVTKGDLKRLAADYGAAADYYNQALKLAPNNLATRIQLAITYIAQDKPKEAQAELSRALAIAPQAPMALYLKGMLLARANKMAEALETLRPVEADIGKDSRGAFLLGLIHLGNNNLEEALQYVSRYHTEYPDNLAGTKLLGNVLFRLRDFTKVILVLAPVRDQLSNDPDMLDILGSAYLAEGNVKEANDALTQSLTLRPNSDDTRGRLALLHTRQGDTRDAGIHELEDLVSRNPDKNRYSITLIASLFGSGQYDKAIEAAGKLVAREPSNPLAYSLRGSARLGKGDQAGAIQDFNTALAKDPDFIPAAINLVDLDLRAGNVSKARSRLDRILERNPAALPALLARAQVEARVGNTAAMIEFLERAIAVNPEALEPRITLLRTLIASDPSKAVSAATELARTQARNPIAVDVASQALIALGKTNEAVAMLKKLQEDYPEQAQIHAHVGKMLVSLGRLPDAATAFDRAISANNTSISAWADRASLELQIKGLGAALAIADKAQRLNPNNDMAKILAGDLLLRSGKHAEAEESYRQALAKSQSPAVMGRLFQAIIINNDRPRARKTMQDWLADHPDDLVNRLVLADDYLTAKEYQAAARQYEALLPKMPRNAVLFNNLANTYDILKDPRALETARTAYSLAPATPGIADTLGYLLLRNGDIEMGTSLLRQAYQGASGDPQIVFHFAKALSMGNDKAAAREVLKPLIEQNIEFAEADEARRLYARLGS